MTTFREGVSCGCGEGIGDIKDQMRNHLNKYKPIKGCQHGFTKGSSCLINLSEFYEAVSDWVDEGKAVDFINRDFKKAFDKVPLF